MEETRLDDSTKEIFGLGNKFRIYLGAESIKELVYNDLKTLLDKVCPQWKVILERDLHNPRVGNVADILTIETDSITLEEIWETLEEDTSNNGAQMLSMVYVAGETKVNKPLNWRNGEGFYKAKTSSW